MAEGAALNLAKRVGTAVVLIPIVLLLVLAAPVAVLAMVAAAVALATTYEFLKLSEAYQIQPFRKPTYLYVFALFILLAINPGREQPLLSTAFFSAVCGFLAALAPFVFLIVGLGRSRLADSLPAATTSASAFAYIALPLAFLVQLRQQWAGAFLIVYLLLVVWAGDIFAYFVGRSLGRHWMSPRVSPKKTWEGAAASMVASVVVGTLLFAHAREISQFLLNLHLIQRKDGIFTLENPSSWTAILLSAAINLAAQLGDLVESLIKRGAGVKDSGSLLPGHGGMLDRIDALLFAAPVMWYFAAWRVLQ